MRNLLILGGVIALGIYASRCLGRQRHGRLPTRTGTRTEPWALAEQRRARARDAGRDARPGAPLRPKPTPGQHGRWDEVDEASDESFPASDPPASWAGGPRDG